MSDNSKIHWTESTWNPVRGCSRVSEGCRHCYAERMAARFSDEGYWGHGFAERTPAGPRWTGRVELVPSKLGQPIRWRKPRMIFVNSTSDLFHESLTNEEIAAVFGVMAACPQHTFQVLTKRAERMREWFKWASDGVVIEQMREVALAGRIAEVVAPERIAPVESWPGYYVTSHGRVLSDRKGPRRELKPMASDQGHQRVMLYRSEGDRLRPLIHRLVLEHFDRAPRDGEQACHIDGNPSNNRLWNLRWGTQSENWQDRLRHGTHQSWSKLNEAQVLSIRRLHRKGDTAIAIAERHGVSDTQVLNIVKGRQWVEPERMEWPLRSVWLGVSAEDQATADERIPHLLRTPAAVRFVSAEPLLGPVNLREALFGYPEQVGPDEWEQTHPPLDWVITGGESGPADKIRPADPDWFRAIRDDCEAAGVAFFHKQHGGSRMIDDAWGGRVLDGRTHDDMPARSEVTAHQEVAQP